MKYINTPAGKHMKDEVRETLLARARYLSAISNSDLGRTSDCIKDYSQIMVTALEKGRVTRFEALVMGYLAHELKFHDMKRSLNWGHQALAWSRKCQCPLTITRNLCSLGQTLLFSGAFDKAEKRLEEAHSECTKLGSKGDLRELGRVLVHSVPLYIARRRWAKAEDHFRNGLELNERFGDRRRAATANAYSAILRFKCGDRQNGIETLHKAISLHREIEDWRNLVGEALTYVWMVSPFRGGTPSQKSIRGSPEEIRGVFDRIAAHPELWVFVGFWQRYFKPVLLD
jgi:tetratricopeptide (TPR) repeat protein